MKVLVDAFPLVGTSAVTGIGRWIEGVLRGLRQTDPDWQVQLFSIGPNRQPELHEVREIVGSYRAYRVASLLGILPRAERVFSELDVSLGPAYIPWPTSRASEVPVVHDLTHLRYPASMSSLNRQFLTRMVPRAVKRAARVMTLSDSVRQEITEAYGFPQERVDVVPPGVDAQRFHKRARALAGMPADYILFVGTMEPRKNLKRLVEAYRIMRSDQSDVPPLVLAGNIGWGPEQTNDLKGQGVMRIGPVEEAALPGLYANASVVAFPSLYEGFGLPVLEAMASGTPVVASKISSVEEVAAEAAAYFDPASPEDIAHALGSVLDDRRLQEEMVRRGDERARLFTWKRSGEALSSSLRMTVAGKSKA